jgi:hypothetical protein
MATIRLFQGEAADALEWANREVLPDFKLLAIALTEHALGHREASDRALEALIAGYGGSAAYQIAEACAWRGETERAFEWLERAYVQRDPGLAHVKTDPHFKAMHADSRWQPFLEKMGFA